MEREWKRYEGTPQRDLFREVRERFLVRHGGQAGWVLELGPGPGRFSPLVGSNTARRVLLDLSETALRYVRESWGTRTREAIPALVRGDGARPPLLAGRFSQVVALGNPLGFAGESAPEFLRSTLRLLAPGGTILLEAVAGAGEHSRYLRRLPPSVVGRLLRSPVGMLRPRIVREGFEPARGGALARHGFHRFSEAELRQAFRTEGVEWREALAVAPLLGSEPDRLLGIPHDTPAWTHLLELEEEFGRQPARRKVAASLLVEGVRVGPSPPPNAWD
ncbi:MAG TPA: class I SAM-dependent methyltransferase [Thermoplasmata archaeon]|nr:class I SAM-dependent methyltransferase [Thermoplasmata archaeon]